MNDPHKLARLAHRQRLTALTRLLRRFDPIGLGNDAPEDEYAPEAGTILPILSRCSDRAAVVSLIHTEFTRWFGPETAGPAGEYDAVGTAVWNWWQQSA